MMLTISFHLDDTHEPIADSTLLMIACISCHFAFTYAAAVSSAMRIVCVTLSQVWPTHWIIGVRNACTPATMLFQT